MLGCGGNNGSGPQNPSPTPTINSISITPGSTSIAIGSNQQFAATAHLSDNTTKDVTSSVQWSSSDSAIAAVSGAGLASASAAGTVTIIATNGTVQGTASLKITTAANNLVSINLSPISFSMPVHTSQQFTATGNYSDGSSSDLTDVVSWNSSSAATATVSPTGLVSSLVAGTTTISASFAGVSQSTTVTVTAPTVASIAITPVGLTLGIGINQQFVATATYTDGTSSDLSGGVTWSSSSPAIASVDGSGLATTLSAGTTTIKATLGSLTDSTDLTVVAAHLVSISLTPAAQSIALGTTQQFTAVGSFDDGSTQLLPSVTWSSSSTSIAAIDNTGLATGVGTGTASITAASGSVDATASLTVTGASLISISVAPANSSMAVGTTRQFTASGTFSDSSTQDVSASVVWTSSNPAASAINSSGLATSVSTGSTTITATFGPISGSTGLTVSNAHLVSISITPANPRIAARTSIRFTAAGTFSDGSVATNLAGVAWKSSKPNIASIRGSGLAHGKKGGSVTISASASGVTGTTTLTVGTGTLQSIAITPATVTANAGGTQQFTATGTFSDGSSQDITLNTHWSSSSASVATIANAPSVGGLARCIAAGTSTIGANSGGTTASAVLTVQ